MVLIGTINGTHRYHPIKKDKRQLKTVTVARLLLVFHQKPQNPKERKKHDKISKGKNSKKNIGR